MKTSFSLSGFETVVSTRAVFCRVLGPSYAIGTSYYFCLVSHPKVDSREPEGMSDSLPGKCPFLWGKEEQSDVRRKFSKGHNGGRETLKRWDHNLSSASGS